MIRIWARLPTAFQGTGKCKWEWTRTHGPLGCLPSPTAAWTRQNIHQRVGRLLRESDERTIWCSWWRIHWSTRQSEWRRHWCLLELLDDRIRSYHWSEPLRALVSKIGTRQRPRIISPLPHPPTHSFSECNLFSLRFIESFNEQRGPIFEKG